MTITVNGQALELPDGQTIAELLAARGLNPRAVVAERNGAVVKRDAFATTTLAAGDRLELLRFVGGG